MALGEEVCPGMRVVNNLFGTELAVEDGCVLVLSEDEDSDVPPDFEIIEAPLPHLLVLALPSMLPAYRARLVDEVEHAEHGEAIVYPTAQIFNDANDHLQVIANSCICACVFVFVCLSV